MRDDVALYPYQKIGSAFIKEHKYVLIGDEMGLGKTIQIIAVLSREKAMGKGPCLIISPATILENWRREILKFSRVEAAVKAKSLCN